MVGGVGWVVLVVGEGSSCWGGGGGGGVDGLGGVGVLSRGFGVDGSTKYQFIFQSFDQGRRCNVLGKHKQISLVTRASQPAISNFLIIKLIKAISQLVNEKNNRKIF